MKGHRIDLTVSGKAAKMLHQLAAAGIFGRSVADVAHRILDEGLERLAQGAGAEAAAVAGIRVRIIRCRCPPGPLTGPCTCGD